MKEKLYPVWLLARRELKDQFRDWRIVFPLIVLTLLFPPLMNATAGQAVDFVNEYGGELILDRLVPFSILIIGFFPVTVSLVVALESFVGEKERGTIEPLLTTPFLDWQLYTGKLLVGIFFPLVASYTSIALYLFMVSKQNLSLPPFTIMLQLILLTAAHALLMVSGAIAISTQSTTVRAANLLASFIVMPVAFLIQGETVLIFWGNEHIIWLAIIAVLVLTTLLTRVGLAHFQREYLLGREVDTLNLKWMWKTFRQGFFGGARSPLQWYRQQIGGVFRKISTPFAILLLLSAVGSVAAYHWTTSMIPPAFSEMTAEEVDEAFEELQSSVEFAIGGDDLSFRFIFFHNIQAVLVMLFLGLVSFGILGGLAFVVNMGILGSLYAILDAFQMPAAAMFLAGVLPHGIFEIPAIIFAGASILYFGALLVTPNPTRTIGEIFILTLADWAKIIAGIILPLLVIAAGIEAYITPQILLQVTP